MDVAEEGGTTSPMEGEGTVEGGETELLRPGKRLLLWGWGGGALWRERWYGGNHYGGGGGGGNHGGGIVTAGEGVIPPEDGVGVMEAGGGASERVLWLLGKLW